MRRAALVTWQLLKNGGSADCGSLAPYGWRPFLKSDIWVAWLSKMLLPSPHEECPLITSIILALQQLRWFTDHSALCHFAILNKLKGIASNPCGDIVEAT
jgi:hypothetical protein